jgi:hypothetical protein
MRHSTKTLLFLLITIVIAILLVHSRRAFGC